MKCKSVERLIFRSFNGLLKKEKKEELWEHLKICPLCRTKRDEYKSILDAMKEKHIPEPQPYFWERLQPKLKERKRYEPLSLWKQWGIRAIPLSLLMVLLLAITIVLFLPHKNAEFSQSEVLLLRNLNPLQETTTLFEEEKVENKNMMLIFTAMEEKNGTRRYFP